MANQEKYFLHNNNIGLRGFQRDDLSVFKNWLSDSAVTKYLEMGAKPYTDQMLEAVYVEACENPNAIVFTICDLKTDLPIGTTGLYLINWPGRRAQYRILVGNADYLGKGIGSAVNSMVVEYGFKRLNFHNIYLGVNADNEAAIKSYKKTGFVEEGRQRDFIYNNGRYHDCIMMSLLSHEYQSHDET